MSNKLQTTMSEAKQTIGYYQLRFGVAIDQDVALWPNDSPPLMRKNAIITDESKKKTASDTLRQCHGSRLTVLWTTIE